jgi:hypothetical protein
MTPSELVGLLYRAQWTDFGVSGTTAHTLDPARMMRRARIRVPLRNPLGDEPPAGTSTSRSPLDDKRNPSLRPAWLLCGYRLRIGDSVRLGGRDGWHVTGTPRPVERGLAPLDRVEAVVDAELGILLRYTEIWDGQPLETRELEEIRVANPDGSPREDDHWEGFPNLTRELGGLVTAADVAAEGLSVLLRHTSKGTAGTPATMPAAPTRASGSVVSPEQVFAISNSGERNFAAVIHEWLDAEALSGPLRTAATKAEMGGLDSLAGVIDSTVGTRYIVRKLWYDGPLRYRVDHVEGGRPDLPATIACDGDELRRFFPGKVVVWPAAMLTQNMLDLVDTAWLLERRLEDVSEIDWYGRPAFRVRARAGERPTRTGHSWPVLGRDLDVIIDRELGVVLRVISFRDDKPVQWTELRDVESPADLDLEIPAGVRVVREPGDFLDKTQLAGPVKTTLRGTADAARLAADGVAAARRFFGRS